MKLMRLRFFLLQFFFACFVQKARSQGTEDGCIMGFNCLAKRLCEPMFKITRLLNGRLKPCGRDKVCCPPFSSPDENVKDENIPELENKGPEEDCLGGYSCFRREMCSPSAMRRINGSPKACGKGKICCPSHVNFRAENIPQPKNKELCGLESNDQSATKLSNAGISDGKYPWMVALMDKKNKEICSGFLVDQRHVVTPADCFRHYFTTTDDPEKFSVRIGSADYRKGRRYNITSIWIHDDYKPGIFYDDIALLSLSEEVDSPDFNPICLPTKSLGDLEGRGGRVVGWGSNSTLLEKAVRIKSAAKCETTFSENFGKSFTDVFPEGFNSQVLCTAPIRNFNINSGSTLMVKIAERWTAVGIYTYGAKIINYFAPGSQRAFARVNEYVDWIKTSIDDM